MGTPAVFKHQVQVPWYDSAEWKFVYHEIFDDASAVNRRQNALRILNIWKLRMPRLFSGVDGTLIILSAILEVYKGFPDETVRQVQASAVMRFLNVCVVNQTKASQETLFQTARNKKLPDWLINLRHDFAHAQRIPSKDMLNRALTFSLNWLKLNYWDQQYSNIKDYTHDQPESNEKLKEFVNLYSQIVLNFEETNSGGVKQKLGRQLRKFNVNMQGSLYSILGQLVKSRIEAKTTNSYKLCDTIIANGAIFDNILESAKEIPAGIVKLWLPMFGLLHYFNHLLTMILLLIRICCANKDHAQSRIAALWIAAISDLLLGKKRGYIIKMEDENFDRRFINLVDDIVYQTNPYMAIYIEKLLTAAKCDLNFVSDISQGVRALYCNEVATASETIYTLDNVQKILGEETFNGLNPVSTTQDDRWELVDDMYMFDGIAIGQCAEGNYHPVLSSFKKTVMVEPLTPHMLF